MLRPETLAFTALLAALTAVGALAMDMYLPSLPSIGELMRTGPAQVQLTISTYLIGFAAGQIVYGPIADRHGRKPVLLVGLGLFCFGTAMCALATSIEILIVGRALQAIGAAGGVVMSRAIVRDLYSGARAGRELSLISTVMGLAPVIAPFIGGILETAFGWRSVFYVLGAFGAMIVAWVGWRLPETLARPATDPLSLGAILRSYRGFFRDGAYLAHLGLGIFAFAGLFAWISGASFILQQLYGLSAFGAGLGIACGAVGYIAGSGLAARFVHRAGLDLLLGFGTLALLGGGLLMTAALALHLDTPFSIVFSAAFYLSGFGLVAGQATAGAITPYGNKAGAASSLFGFVQLSVSAIAGIAVAQMLDASVWPLALIMVLLGVSAFVLWAATRRIRRRSVLAAAEQVIE